MYRGADKSLARPDWRNNWKVRIFCPEVIAAAETWLDGQSSEFFLSGLQSQSSVAVACFLPGRAKDLSALWYIGIYPFGIWSHVYQCSREIWSFHIQNNEHLLPWWFRQQCLQNIHTYLSSYNVSQHRKLKSQHSILQELHIQRKILTESDYCTHPNARQHECDVIKFWQQKRSHRGPITHVFNHSFYRFLATLLNKLL